MTEVKIGKWLGRGLTALLIVLFCVIGTISLTSIFHMQGNARVINYTGIVRGATQRLVKQEIHGAPNDELIGYLDGILAELATGEGENGLIALPDAAFQDLVAEMSANWTEIKDEIGLVRVKKSSEDLYLLSEKYFALADSAVSAAEKYSESKVGEARNILIVLDLAFALLVLLFWLYGRRQKRIQRALDTARSANSEKSKFLSRMSHEIRTPMNGIIGMTAIARGALDDRDKVADCLKKIDLSSSYLLGVINDVLDMSRIESGKIELENRVFRLSETIEQLESMLEQKAREKGVEFSVECDSVTADTLIGDPLRISQILVNIVANALKFTPRGGRVTLSVRETAVSDAGASLEFAVTDTGIGISPGFQKKIFQPFEQEQSSTSRQYGGTGLGLAISYNFAVMMGGNITVQSKEGEGSRFVVHLTLARPTEETAAETPAPAPAARDLRGVRLLLAEDNEINAEIAVALLEGNGAEVRCAADGREALEQFAASEPGRFDMILMDIQMPVMDGLAACRAIRALDRADAKSIPIIGVSANAFSEDVDKALACGMNGYLAKPIDLAKLCDSVGEFVTRRT